MRIYRLIMLLVSVSSIAYGQNEKITSKLYFPGLVGMDFHLYDANQHLKNGIVLNTGAEYRPNSNPFFYRLNYDGITSKYRSDVSQSLPTNVKSGTIHANYYLIGVGYRRKLKQLGWYFLIQSGLEQRNYDRVLINPIGFGIDQVNRKALAIKLTGGGEYYLAPHFALIAEPAFYPNSYYSQRISSNGNFSLSIGFTTTLF